MFAGAFAMLVGATVFVAWIVGLDGVKRVFPGLPQMKANTALALVALGCAVVLLREGRCRRCWSLGHGLALVVALFGAVVLGEYLFGGVGIDQLLFHDSGPAQGRPGPLTAVAFLLVGLALTTLDSDEPRYRPSGWLLPAGGLVVLSAMVGYLYQVEFLRATTGTTGIALHTVLALVVLVVGALCLRPGRGLVGYLRRDDPGAASARRMLPAAILIPVCLGWLGRGADGLGFDARTADGLIALATICTFAALMLITARRLSNTDDRRRVAERAAQRLATIVASSEDAIVSVDLDGNIETWNEGASRLFRYTSEEAIGSPSTRLVAPEHRAEAAEVFARVLSGSPIEHHETVALTKDRRQIDVGMSGFPIHSTVEVIGAGSIVHDITQRKHADLAVARLAAVVEASHDAIITKDLDGIVTSWNHGAERLYGHSEAEMIGRPISVLVPSDHENELPAILERVRAGRRAEDLDTVRERKNGSLIDVSLTVSPIWSPDGTIIGASTIARDITARLRDRAELRFLAEHDPLTGAGNRRGFELAISEHVDRARRHDDHAALLLIDIDDFKQINDTYGHTAGDRALQLVAGTLTRRLREGDQVARIGGDEFAILLPEASESVASAVASDLKRLAQDTTLDLGNGTHISFSISVGIAIIDKTTASQETVVDMADHAMYEDKHRRLGKLDSNAIAPNHPRRLRQRSRPRAIRRPHQTTTGRAAVGGSNRFQRDAMRR